MGPLDRGSAPSGFVASHRAPWRVAFNPGSEVFRVPPSLKMAAAEEDELPLPRLPELFDISRRLLDEVEVATEPTGSRAVQEKVLKGLQLLKQAAEMLAQLDLFSQNEDLEEIASTDLKYLMVPAFQGALAMKQGNPSKRLDHLQLAREHFLNYLTQCQHYHVAEFELPKTKNNSAENNTASSSMAHPSLVAMASQRQAKIERWIGICLEEIESIDQEMDILRGKDSSKEASTSHSSRPSRPPMKPFILTRDAAQAKVFGAGYPSLATMTVNDWYDQHRKLGALPDQGVARTTSVSFALGDVSVNILLRERPKEQLNKKIKNKGRKRMMSKHSTELGSGMTGRTPILGAMATERTWVSLPTTRWDYRGRTSSPQRKAVSSPPWAPFSSTKKAKTFNLALRSIKCQAIKCVLFPR
ncbi:immunoglobulin-binding protein 1 isoform X2 [Myotis lucifugus]|uniref:immunoglobulin-binding protein 1 isoform X2 n=1 Tax=Myotis lucifugus TaxID=59463 RepID=UPI000CCC684E|nr:immunoglobulin-binding protein 1 isoform X2 [Myotis lucifugus]